MDQCMINNIIVHMLEDIFSFTFIMMLKKENGL